MNIAYYIVSLITGLTFLFMSFNYYVEHNDIYRSALCAVIGIFWLVFWAQIKLEQKIQNIIWHLLNLSFSIYIFVIYERNLFSVVAALFALSFLTGYCYIVGLIKINQFPSNNGIDVSLEDLDEDSKS